MIESLQGPPRGFVGYGRHRPQIDWPDGARLAISLVVNYEEGSENSLLAGDGRNEVSAEFPGALPPTYRDLCNESVFEYGSRAGVWRLERLLTRLGLPVTFFASAVALEVNPEVAAWIRESNHEAAGHGYRWQELWELSRDAERDQLEAAVASIEHSTGQRPVGWYSRHSPSVHTRQLLVEAGGFRYDSDALNDDLPYFTRVDGHRHLVIPYSHVYNDARWLQGDFADPSSFVDYCTRAIDVLWREGATAPVMMSIGLHPRWIGQAGRIHALEEILSFALDRGDIWFARRCDIAEWWWTRYDHLPDVGPPEHPAVARPSASSSAAP